MEEEKDVSNDDADDKTMWRRSMMMMMMMMMMIKQCGGGTEREAQLPRGDSMQLRVYYIGLMVEGGLVTNVEGEDVSNDDDDDDDDKAMWRRNRAGGSVTQRRLNQCTTVVAGLLHWVDVRRRASN